jgi:hypothetical protein
VLAEREPSVPIQVIEVAQAAKVPRKFLELILLLVYRQFRVVRQDLRLAGALIGFMTWMWMWIAVLIAGGELNSEIEQQAGVEDAAEPGVEPGAGAA